MNPEPVQQASPSGARAASRPGKGRRVVKHFADFLRHVRRRGAQYAFALLSHLDANA